MFASLVSVWSGSPETAHRGNCADDVFLRVRLFNARALLHTRAHRAVLPGRVQFVITRVILT